MALAFSHKERTAGASLAAAAIRDDANLRDALRAHVVTACAAMGLPPLPVERQDQLVLLALTSLFGPLPEDPR